MANRLEDRATTTYRISVPYVLDRQHGDLARETARRLAQAGINGDVVASHGIWEGKTEDGAIVTSQDDIPKVLRVLAEDRALQYVHMQVQTAGPSFGTVYKDLGDVRS